MRLSDIAAHADVPLGQWRPIKMEITCDCGGLFCERFERETTPAAGFAEIYHEAVALGWLETQQRNIAPGCRR